MLILRGVLPAVFAIAMGVLVGAVQRGDGLAGPLAFAGAVFVLLQVLTPIHQAVSANLGDRTAAWLYDRLTEACVRPPGMGHLEDSRLTDDLTVARDFDLGMTGPPLSISMDFIAGGLVEMIGGLSCACVLAAYAWWAPLLLGGAWLATHWLLRESAIWRDRNTDEVRSAQRDADYAYTLAVDPPPAKELRLFGLADWTIDRFVKRRTRLHALQYEATRLREKPMLWSLLLVVGANLLVFWSLAQRHGERQPRSWPASSSSPRRAVGTSMIAFGGLNWALDGSAAPVAAVLRLEAAMAPAGALSVGSRAADEDADARHSLPRSHLCVPWRRTGTRRLRSHHSRRILARHRRAERRRQDDARQAVVPVVRPAVRRDRDRRRRPARARPEVVAVATRRRVPGFHSLSSCRCATTSRQQVRRTTWSAPRSSRLGRRISPASTRCWRAATTAAPSSRAGSGSASRSLVRCAP